MERDEILREDFPSARRGWDPDAVRAHLRRIAETARDAGPTLAQTAGDRVASVIGAAEEKATEIEADARREAEEIVARAREEAADLVERAQRAVEGLVGQTDQLRSRVGALGEQIVGELRGRAAEEAPEQVAVSEPQPAVISEPEPVSAVPNPAQPAPEPEAVVEPPPAVSSGTASTEDLIAQLKGPNGSDEASLATEAPTAAAVSGSNVGAARLVAMNMALEGAGREQIEAQLRSEFGELEALGSLLDEVLARAGR